MGNSEIQLPTSLDIKIKGGQYAKDKKNYNTVIIRSSIVGRVQQKNITK